MFGRDTHHFHPKVSRLGASGGKVEASNVFDGANDALFRALPFWGSLCVLGVVGVSALQLFWPMAARARARARGLARQPGAGLLSSFQKERVAHPHRQRERDLLGGGCQTKRKGPRQAYATQV